MMNLTTNDFQEILRVINCMSGEDFKIVFGSSYEHYLDKRAYLGLGEFVCYLDNGNIEQILKHAQHKMDTFRNSQRNLA